MQMNEPGSLVITGYCSNQAGFERECTLSFGQLIKITHKRSFPIILRLLKWASFQLLCHEQEPLALSVQSEPDGKTKLPVSHAYRMISKRCAISLTSPVHRPQQPPGQTRCVDDDESEGEGAGSRCLDVQAHFNLSDLIPFAPILRLNLNY